MTTVSRAELFRPRRNRSRLRHWRATRSRRPSKESAPGCGVSSVAAAKRRTSGPFPSGTTTSRASSSARRCSMVSGCALTRNASDSLTWIVLQAPRRGCLPWLSSSTTLPRASTARRRPTSRPSSMPDRPTRGARLSPACATRATASSPRNGLIRAFSSESGSRWLDRF